MGGCWKHIAWNGSNAAGRRELCFAARQSSHWLRCQATLPAGAIRRRRGMLKYLCSMSIIDQGYLQDKAAADVLLQTVCRMCNCRRIGRRFHRSRSCMVAIDPAHPSRDADLASAECLVRRFTSQPAVDEFMIPCHWPHVRGGESAFRSSGEPVSERLSDAGASKFAHRACPRCGCRTARPSVTVR